VYTVNIDGLGFSVDHVIHRCHY